MFGSIAHRYDLLNHLLSLNLDRRWRRRAARFVCNGHDSPRVLDLCAGTGDLSLEVARRGAGARVVALDFVAPMLEIAAEKIERAGAGGRVVPVCGDGLCLPFRDGTFDALTVAFGVRNLSSLESGIAEMARVLRPGGRLAVLEFSLPKSGLWRRLYAFYFFRVLPKLGKRISGTSAYSYLPASVATFPEPAELSELLRRAGFEGTQWRSLAGGAVALHTARKRS